MESFQAEGLWWDAERPARVSAGVLNFDPTGPSHIHLIGGWLDDGLSIRTSFDPADLTEEQRNELAQLANDTSRPDERPAVEPDDFPTRVEVAHGVIDGAKVTLFGLTEFRRNDGSVPGLTTQTFAVSYVIRGDWIEREATTEHCRFSLDTLDAWCAWSGSIPPAELDDGVPLGACTLPDGDVLQLRVGSSRSLGLFEVAPRSTRTSQRASAR